LKVAVDVSEHLSANVKFCYGCHGFEADMVYFDMRAFDELNVRVGRFSPSFGSFNLRHDPGNHKLSDKPLPYDMGRMLRNAAWNNGVLPSPFPDNGVEVNGAHWARRSARLRSVRGWRLQAKQPRRDGLALGASRSPTTSTTDDRPSAKIALTGKLSAVSEVTIGASAGWNTPRPERQHSYTSAARSSARIDRASIRLILVRAEPIRQPGSTNTHSPTTSGRSSSSTALLPKSRFLQRGDVVGRVDGLPGRQRVATSELSSRARSFGKR
jgi:hypothetical protein